MSHPILNASNFIELNTLEAINQVFHKIDIQIGWVVLKTDKKSAVALLTPNSHTMIKRLSSNNFEGQKILH